MRKIVNCYRGMTRIFLLIVDRDCDDNRRAKLDALEKRAETMLAGTDRCFPAENAWQESEVWVLAGMSDLPDDWRWKEIRQDCDPKEHYYGPYARQRNVDKDPARGPRVFSKGSRRALPTHPPALPGGRRGARRPYPHGTGCRLIAMPPRQVGRISATPSKRPDRFPILNPNRASDHQRPIAGLRRIDAVRDLPAPTATRWKLATGC